MWHNKAMDKGKIEAMATKFSKIFAISMLKKNKKICRRGLTHLNATPIIQIQFRVTKVVADHGSEFSG